MTEDATGDGGVTIDNLVALRGEATKPAYSPFHLELDEKYPVDNLLSQENIRTVVRGEVTPWGWVRTFCQSPIKNSEAESIIGQVVATAIRAGQWVDIPMKKDEPLGNAHGMDWDVTLGTAKWEYTN
jgi:hypothetical protein